MAPSTAASTDVLTDACRRRARAEFREVEAMLTYRAAEMARTAGIELPMRRQVERSAICFTIAEAMRLSEAQVQLRLAAADTVHDQAPVVWAAFRDGLVDLGRVRDIAGTIGQLKHADSIHRLDGTVVAYAVGHTGAELRAWLRRFVQRVEADLAVERAETQRADRHVTVRHGEDAMAWLVAYLPSHQAAAIEARLRHEARRIDDDRTIAQREADLLTAWSLNPDTTTGAPIPMQIGVTIDAGVLAGAHRGFAESTDGRWGVPAGWVTETALLGNAFWNRIVLDPVTGDVLSHEYLGRFAPSTLELALRFRDGVCQAPGCMVPAERCENDHRVPHPAGPTSAANMGPLCHRHHVFKSHGILTWSALPPPAPIFIDLWRDSPPVECVPAAA